MKRIVRYLLVILSASFCFLSAVAKACSSEPENRCISSSEMACVPSPNCALPKDSCRKGRTSLPARFSANGYGSTDYLVGQADLMLPLQGDAGHNFYIDPGLAYGSDSQGYADLGIGYRWIKNSSAILGGYLFGGYSRIDNNARLWVVNPGIEALGSRWDAHLNGYLVMGDRNETVSSFLTFDEFSGHSELFNLFDVKQHAGDGADVKLGYQLFPSVPLKAYVGSYFFSPSETNNVLGGAVGLEYWVSQTVKVFANYTYDNLRRSVGALGLGVELGGTHVHRSDPSLEERITDPVERNLAELGRGSAIPSQTKTQLMGQIVPANMNSMVFFSQTGTPNNGGINLTADNCTFENPCGPTDLTNQGTQTLETLIPNTMMFFNGGTYSALDVPGGTNPVTIRTGQSINSTAGTSPSTFEGGFILEGNNNLNTIVVQPTVDTATGTGVQALGGEVNINGSQIGSTTSPFATGFALSGNTQANLNNSMVFASANGVTASDSAGLTTNASMINVNGGDNIFGINSSSSGPLSLTQGSTVNVNGGGTGTFGVNASGDGDFVLSDASSINVTGGNISTALYRAGAGSVTVSGASSINLNANGSPAIGFADQGSGSIDFKGASSINVNTNAGSAVGYSHLGTSSINFSEGSSINVTAPGQNTIVGFADVPGASGDITFDASLINVTGGDQVGGLISEGSGNLNIINNSKFNVTGGNDSSGLYILGNRRIRFLDSEFMFTGGDNSFGFDSENGVIGDIEIRRSRWNFTQGNNSFGFNFRGNGNITIDTSTQDFIGGSGYIGFNTAGSGSVTVSGGSAFNVTAGANSFVYTIEGSGPVNISGGSSFNMNASGQNAVGGIRTLSSSSSALTFDGSQINVNGGNNARGFFGQGSGNVVVSGGSAINVTGGPSSIGYLDAAGSGLVFFNGANSITVNAAGENLAVGFGSTVGSGSNITLDGTNITVFGGDNSRGVSFAGSDVINLIGNTITVNAADYTGVQGLLSTTGSTGNMNVNGTQITVNAGNNAQGYNVSGNGTIAITADSSITVNAAGFTPVTGVFIADTAAGDVTFDSSQITVTGGNSTIGVNYFGSGNIGFNNGSRIMATGGNDVRAFSDSGSGAVNLAGTSTQLEANATGLGIGFTVTGGSPSVVTSNGVQIRVTGGDTTRGFGTSGTGNINLSNTSITVNGNPSVANTVSGLLMNGGGSSAVTISGGQINVLNGNNVNGVAVLGSGTINLQNGELINVNGNGLALGININTNTGGGSGGGAGSVTGNNINITTSSTGNQSIGLFTSTGTSGSITIGGSDIDVSGGTGSAIRQDLGGGNIVVNVSTCRLNGNLVTC